MLTNANMWQKPDHEEIYDAGNDSAVRNRTKRTAFLYCISLLEIQNCGSRWVEKNRSTLVSDSLDTCLDCVMLHATMGQRHSEIEAARPVHS